jgi:N-acetylglucosaminyldiphosphoundecaprenol N-acetyl-beta-D-mannosaminyltransferase
MFLLGAKPGVAEKMKKNLEQKYNEIIISGVQDGYFDRQTGNDEVIEKINNSGAKILLVAFGAPNQEKWIYTNLQKLDVHAAIGVGGLFDFYSGNMPRAPKWMRELGIEWVFRLIKEPGRMWRRYIIGNPLFLQRVRDWNKAITGKKSESKN